MPSGGITVDEALGHLATGGVLVDVRTLEEYVAGHAPGARLVDVAELRQDAFGAVFGDDPLAQLEPEAKLVVLICDTGLRSGHLVPVVREQGLRCEFIGGGLHAWRDAGQMLLPGPPRRR